MNYGNKTFSVAMGSKEFSEGWERTFGKKVKAVSDASTCCAECNRIPEDGLMSVSKSFPGCSYHGDCKCHDVC